MTDDYAGGDEHVRETLSAGRESVKEALERLSIDPLTLLRTPWDTLHDVIGPIWPTDLWYVGAASGNGKTSLLAHLVESFIARGKRVYLLSLEQKQSELRVALAALALGYHPQHCLENAWHKLPAGAEANVRQALITQIKDYEGKMVFSKRTSLGIEHLPSEMAFAERMDASIVVLDHLHRVEGAAVYGQLVAFCGALDRLTNEFQIPVLSAVQLNRGEKDPLQPYRPPSIYDIQGGEVVRQSAAVCLGLYRPMEPLTGLQARQIRTGELKLKSFLRPNKIGVTILKHRKRGEAVVSDPIELDYIHGRIKDPKTIEREALEERMVLEP